MRELARQRIVVGKDDVVVPDVYRALSLGIEPEIWADAQTVAPMLDDADLGRAVQALEAVHGLGYLLQLGASDLESMGLSPSECSRFLAFPSLAGRLLCARTKMTDASTRRDLADEINFRAVSGGWTETVAGLVSWNACGQRVADRILAVGVSGVSLDIRQILRTVLNAPGAVVFTLWFFEAASRIQVSEQDRRIADEVRAACVGVGLRLEDLLLVASGGDAVSLAVLDQWVD